MEWLGGVEERIILILGAVWTRAQSERKYKRSTLARFKLQVLDANYDRKTGTVKKCSNWIIPVSGRRVKNWRMSLSQNVRTLQWRVEDAFVLSTIIQNNRKESGEIGSFRKKKERNIEGKISEDLRSSEKRGSPRQRNLEKTIKEGK